MTTTSKVDYRVIGTTVHSLLETEALYRRGVITPGEYYSRLGDALVKYEKAVIDANPNATDVCERSSKMYALVVEML